MAGTIQHRLARQLGPARQRPRAIVVDVRGPRVPIASTTRRLPCAARQPTTIVRRWNATWVLARAFVLANISQLPLLLPSTYALPHAFPNHLGLFSNIATDPVAKEVLHATQPTHCIKPNRDPKHALSAFLASHRHTSALPVKNRHVLCVL